MSAIAAPTIQTLRMRLIPVSPRLLEAENLSFKKLSRLLNAEIPERWPPASLLPMKNWFQERITGHPHKTGWFLWYGILERIQTDILVMSCGFMDPPDVQGGVELGYALLQPWQGKGLASEAAQALLAWAFSHPEVTHVRAHTARGNLASSRILEKCGFIRLETDPTKPAIDRFICYRPSSESMDI
ncbi:RimJ/RimL family protein N-acetyltransferase [Desulfobotulus alkaliphilus]|uniref:RimJ/RimL family protein N-acetyltransferase n=1 Tax=Desulfobotulus alkaliphilus TaxID=622671 RepID=A0A562R4H1_9BACT|nr:GNAT family N-acetyltransferase [Desulfobotulus alkaliphilus]TWI63965.1 RimJ/RimL family protein N-acetyltransferase [Desulfobotulus alkaliphilus]